MSTKIIIHSPTDNPMLKAEIAHFTPFFGGEPLLMYQCCLDLLTQEMGYPSVHATQSLVRDMVLFCKGSRCNTPSIYHVSADHSLNMHTLMVDLCQLIPNLMSFFCGIPTIVQMIGWLKPYHHRLRIDTESSYYVRQTSLCLDVVPNPPTLRSES